MFSSNTLEHVKQLDILLKEMRRVLKPRGTMVHILPTSAWRLCDKSRALPLCGEDLDRPRAAARRNRRTGDARVPGERQDPLTCFEERTARPGSRRISERVRGALLLQPVPMERCLRTSRAFGRGSAEDGPLLHRLSLVPKLSLRTRASLSAVLGSSGRSFLRSR